MRHAVQALDSVALVVGSAHEIVGISEGIQHRIPLGAAIKSENLPLVPLRDYGVTNGETELISIDLRLDVLPSAGKNFILVITHVAYVVRSANNMDGLESGIVSHHGQVGKPVIGRQSP